ncbi:MAG: hypothetical protein AAB369_02720, partial [Chloroflexota bacterium]
MADHTASAATSTNATFCPNVNSQDATAGGEIGKVAQKVYPNMLFSALVRGGKLYVPVVAAALPKVMD